MELDFRGCHPNIARTLAGQPPVSDPYADYAAAFNLPREQVKSMLLPILHGRTRAQHLRLYGRDPGAGFLFDVLREAPVSGERLLELEAEIMARVLRRMKAAGIPSGLPVFDSILTVEPEAVERFMLEESESVLGHVIPVRRIPCETAGIPFLSHR